MTVAVSNKTGVTHFEAAAMRVTLALIGIFLTTSGPGLSDNPYAAAGISNPAHVTQFLARLKQAVAADDHTTVAAMIKYPLTVIHQEDGL
jgi:hypothetical protein